MLDIAHAVCIVSSMLCTYNYVGYSACSMYCEQYVVCVQAHVVLVLDVVHIVTYA